MDTWLSDDVVMSQGFSRAQGTERPWNRYLFAIDGFFRSLRRDLDDMLLHVSASVYREEQVPSTGTRRRAPSIALYTSSGLVALQLNATRTSRRIS